MQGGPILAKRQPGLHCIPTIRLAEAVACLETKGLKKVAVRVQPNARDALPLGTTTDSVTGLESHHLMLTLISISFLSDFDFTTPQMQAQLDLLQIKLLDSYLHKHVFSFLSGVCIYCIEI